MTTLHAGGKFDSKVYETSGGLHGVGVSVVNALSERMEVEVARGRKLYRQTFSRGMPQGKLEKVGRAPNRRGTKVRFQPDPQIFGDKAAVQARRACSRWRARRPICSAASRSAGTARRRCSKATTTSGRRRPSISRRPDGLSRADDSQGTRRWSPPSIFTGKVGKTGSARRASNGRSPGRPTQRRLLSLLLQHHPDARRRHARGRPAHRAYRGPARPCRARRTRASARQRSRRRRDDRRAAHALGVHPRAGIPGPDQGQARHRRGAAASSKNAIATRSTTGSPANPQQANKPARLGDRPRRRAPAPPPGKGSRAQDRDAQAAPARQARRLHQRRRAGLRALHRRGRLGRRLRQAGARPRERRPCCRCAARSSTSPPPARTSSPATSSSPTSSRRSAAARAALPRRGPALREGHHHDRRRRRRRAHRLAADHLLLSPDAAAHRRRAPLSRGAAALPPHRTAARRSTRATTRTRTNS